MNDVQSMFLIRTFFPEVSIVSLFIKNVLYKHINVFTFLSAEMSAASNGAKKSSNYLEN
jgi:hypothetical protein